MIDDTESIIKRLNIIKVSQELINYSSINFIINFLVNIKWSLLFWSCEIVYVIPRDPFLGLGYSQAFGAFCVVSYYCGLMALTLHYLVSSFQSELPWSICRPEWQDYCIDVSNKSVSEDRNAIVRSSAELYFRFETETVLIAFLKV